MYIAIDEGTTNLKVVIFDDNFKAIKLIKEKVSTYYPQEGWVEQNMDDVWKSLINILRKLPIQYKEIEGLGITNQRETTVLWDSTTGKTVYNAIVWQCRRTAKMIEELKKEYGEIIKEKTGLEPDPYFSASKIKWLLDRFPKIKERAKEGRIKFGTVDTYLLWKLTGGKVHATDHTNASRTMIYNIRNRNWDDELLEIFDIPEEMLPEIKDSAGYFGETQIYNKKIEITGIIGDQQSALLAHGGIKEGDMKITYGTGTFLLLNTGNSIEIKKGILTTVAWSINGTTNYALEGSILSSGSVVEWLKSIGLWSDISEEENSVYFVPAFSGLGSPYWDPLARGAIFGITQKTKKIDITRAALESIGYMVRDIIEEMGKEIRIIMADGGMTENDFLMQFQADITGIPVRVPDMKDMTARGAAILSAIGKGNITIKDIKPPEKYREYRPMKDHTWREKRYKKWKDAVRRSMRWDE